MKLNQLEEASALWKRIETEIQDRLNVARMKNDGDHDAVKTAEIRGSIRTYKEILDWAKPSPGELHRDL